jgi:hypothetical protein
MVATVPSPVPLGGRPETLVPSSKGVAEPTARARRHAREGVVRESGRRLPVADPEVAVMAPNVAAGSAQILAVDHSNRSRGNAAHHRSS